MKNVCYVINGEFSCTEQYSISGKRKVLVLVLRARLNNRIEKGQIEVKN